METLDFVIILVSGILFGLTFSLVTFTTLVTKKRRDRLTANILFYRDILSKKENKKHQYKNATRQVINYVHTSILIHTQDSEPPSTPLQNNSEPESSIAYFPNPSHKSG